METKSQNKWKGLLQALRSPTKICKICFEPIDENNVYNFLHKNACLCSKCRRLFEPKFSTFKIEDCKAIAIYDYDETIRSYLYQFKGCYDYELVDTFIQPYYLLLRIMFDGYTIVPVPSYEGDNEIRGFNHVESIFSGIGLKILKPLEKVERFKQSNNAAEDRKQVENYLKIKRIPGIEGKKILLVDDVLTTGSTIKSCIKLLRKLKPKKIKVLVMSRTIFDSSISPN